MHRSGREQPARDRGDAVLEFGSNFLTPTIFLQSQADHISHLSLRSDIRQVMCLQRGIRRFSSRALKRFEIVNYERYRTCLSDWKWTKFGANYMQRIDLFFTCDSFDCIPNQALIRTDILPATFFFKSVQIAINPLFHNILFPSI